MENLLLTVLIPALVGTLVAPVMQGLKKASAWVDALPGWAKQLIVVVMSVGATYLTKLSGVPIPGDILHLPGEGVTALLSALFAFGVHAIFRKPS